MTEYVNKLDEELILIKIAIALDQGLSKSEVAKNFKVKISTVNSAARKSEYSKPYKKKITKRRFTDIERRILVERIASGESIDSIATEQGITQKTIRLWCKKNNINIPRDIEQIKLTERIEIRKLTELNSAKEIAAAYNITIDAAEELGEPPYNDLDTETLSYLYELIREKPKASDKVICRIAKEAKFKINEEAVNSYRLRLRLLDQI